LVLQDLVNEIGGRIGFDVTAGRYRGTVNADTIGFDGLWKSPSEESIVVEIKTSSTYNINLNTVGKYKKQLIQSQKCIEDKTSILLVVGRFDTEAWESQIRGSKRSWDTRIISVAGLIRLLEIKESIDEAEVFNKISNILTPQEYTKVDGIIDIVFSTTEDLLVNAGEIDDEDEKNGQEKKKASKFTPVSFYAECMSKIQTHLNIDLIKNTRTTYVDSKKEVTVMCLVSREYQRKDSGFWFAFHPHQKEILMKSEKGLLGLGCGSSDLIILFPINTFTPHLDKMNTTIKEDRTYHHIHILKKDGDIFLKTKGDFEHIKITEFKI
jgi:hypothetical protein